MGGLNFLGGSLAEGVNQLGEELGDADRGVGIELEAEGTNDGIDVLDALLLGLDAQRIQDEGAGLQVTYAFR